MIKITASFAILSIFLSFSPSAFAAQNFEYFFGTLLVPRERALVVNSVSSASLSDVVINNPNSAQILAIQTNLNQIKLTLANLNSNLTKSNSNPKIAIARGIPLLLSEEKKKEENTQSVFASLIPPDVRNFPFIVTNLVVLTLGLLGVIIYLFFLRRQEKKQPKRLT